MKKHTILAAATALLIGGPMAAVGQSTYEPSQWWDDRWYITPSIGYVLSDDDRRADDGWQGALAIGRPITPSWNLELRGFYEELDGKSGGPGKYKNWGATLDAQWFFMRQRGLNYWTRIQPYAVFGVGGINDDVPGQSDWSFVANAGLGFVWPFSDWGRVVGDVRYRWDDNSGKIATNDNFDDWIFSLGLQIPLGPKPRVAEAPRPAPAPAPVVVPPPAPTPPPPPPPKPTTRTFDISADGMFAFDSAELTAVGRTRIDEIIAAIRGTGFTATSVLITGHTDPLGPEAHNQRLSERRANVVRDYIVSKGGVSPSIVRAEGRGESQLRITEADCKAKGQARTRQALIACLAPDRRVEATVTGTQAAK